MGFTQLDRHMVYAKTTSLMPLIFRWKVVWLEYGNCEFHKRLNDLPSVCRDCIPTKSHIQSWGVNCSPLCAIGVHRNGKIIIIGMVVSSGMLDSCFIDDLQNCTIKHCN